MEEREKKFKTEKVLVNANASQDDVLTLNIGGERTI